MSPVGSWRVTVARPAGPSVAVLCLAPDGRATLAGGTTGTGTWTSTGPDRFGYRLAEPIVDAAGTVTGWVHIEQRAVLAGDTFTSEGVTVVCDAGGEPAYRTPVAVTGTSLESAA